MRYQTVDIGQSHYSVKDNGDGTFSAFAAPFPYQAYLGTFNGQQSAFDAIQDDYRMTTGGTHS